MENKRKVARPLGNVNEVIDIFLGMPFEDKGTIKYKRIDTLDIKQLNALAERKKTLDKTYNKYHTFKSFIESEINNAKRNQSWFNKVTEKENYYTLQNYIDFLTNDFKDNSISGRKNKFSKRLEEIDFKAFLIEQEKEKYQPLLDEILKQEKNLHNPLDKISFLQIEKQKYISSLSNESLVSSGDIIGINNERELFMDREITNRIKEIELEISIKEKAIQIIKDQLKEGYNEWKIKLRNPLADWEQYLNAEKEKCEKAIAKAKDMNNRLYHGKPSILNHKETNELNRLKVINDFLANPIPLTISKTEKTKENNLKIKAPTLRELALYYEYLGYTITKDNANELLKKTKYKSGAKLKQNFDFIHKTINRINIDTDRKNNHRLKEFETVINMLKKSGNKTAISKAESEYNTFKNKID